MSDDRVIDLVFVYDWPHWKSSRGLDVLASCSVEVGCVLGAPWEQLSPDDLTPVEADVDHPARVCRRLGWRYESGRHETEVVASLLSSSVGRTGLVLGARILSPGVVSQFSQGVINIHPGLLPWNRGLDSAAWAVLLGIPQGVTAHLISERIDLGPVLSRFVWYPSRASMDLRSVRAELSSLELEVLRRCLISADRRELSGAPWPYHSRMPLELNGFVEARLPTYLTAYQSIRSTHPWTALPTLPSYSQ